jgi:hypothetical protein
MEGMIRSLSSRGDVYTPQPSGRLHTSRILQDCPYHLRSATYALTGEAGEVENR